MLDRRDIELFEILATSFVVRGRKSWPCAELVDRLQALGLPIDCSEALKNLCAAGWLQETSEDIFDLTDEGIRVARTRVGPFASGGL